MSFSSFPQEELACDSRATAWLLDCVEIYSTQTNEPADKVRAKRAMGILVGLFCIGWLSAPDGSASHPPLKEGLSGANAPILYADYISYAQYYAGLVFSGYLDSQWTASYTSAVKTNVDLFLTGDPTNIATAFQWLKDDFTTNSTTYQNYMVSPTGRCENYNTLAAAYGKKVMLYEHNQEFGAPSVAWCTAAPMSDASYGGEAGKINQFILAWLASSYYQDVQTAFLTQFYARSQSQSSSIFGMCTGDAYDGANLKSPWLTFAKLAPTTETFGGDTTQTPYKNWDAHAAWNNSH